MQSEEVANKCHINRGPLCQYKEFEDMGEAYHRAYLAYMEITKGGTLINNEECVKGTINKLYWTSKAIIDEIDDVKDNTLKFIFLGVTIGILFLIALFLFLLYIKRQKSAASEIERESLGTEEDVEEINKDT